MIGTRQKASIWAHLDDDIRRLAGDSEGAAILQSHSLALNHRQEASMTTGIVPQGRKRGSMSREQEEAADLQRTPKKREEVLCY